MAEWARLCALEQAPNEGDVAEIEAGRHILCVARTNGTLHAMDNLCPHRDGPLGQGWIEGNTVVCPWHAWAFDVQTGQCLEPEAAQVRVFTLREQEGELLVDLS